MPWTVDKRQRAVLAIILASYLMLVLDVSIVITGLPKIKESLGFTTTTLSWVQNAYILAFGGLLLLGARAGDLLGRKRMFILGLVVFTLASVAIGLAQSAAWLLAARAAQGVGAAVLAPSTLALLSTHFSEGAERTRAVGYYAAIAGIGASLGLVLGGLFADWISWRAGFFINLPIGLVLAHGAKRHLVETERHTGELDLAGALASTLGMGALVFGLVHAADHGWGDALTLASLGTGVLLLATLVWIETHAAHPIMPLRLFADRERAGALAARVLFLGGMVGFWYFTTQFLQNVLGYRPALAGLAFLPTTLPNFAAALLAPKLVRRFGNARVLLAGLATAAAGLLWLAQARAGSNYWTAVALPMVLVGIGQGGALGPLTTAGIAGVHARDAGAASGLLNAAHQLGGSLGLAILVVVFASAAVRGGSLAMQLASAFTGVAALVGLSLLVTLCTARWRAMPDARQAPAA
jgi:EmrB/QacA subfamily drug resistance transporter